MVVTAADLERIEEHIRLHGDQDVCVSNDERIELNWAVRAGKYVESYEKLVSSIPLEKLHFTTVDEALHTAFRHEFPDLNVRKLDLDYLAQKDVLAKFRGLVNIFECVPNAKLLTILRADALRPTGPDNSTMVPRVQFYMIELARLREGITAEFAAELRRIQEEESN